MKLIDMDVATLISQSRKSDANPGGGAILILISNLAINLCLMMDKDDFGNLSEKANVSRETLLHISKQYEKFMQDDVDNFNQLMDKIKKKEAKEIDYKNAARLLISMVDGNLKSLEEISFFLENGKKSTLTDGQISNDLLYQAILSSFATIKINLDQTDLSYDFDEKTKLAKNLYQKNLDIIERRNK